MELRYEVLRKKQEDYIKDMEQCVFKRETIQLKYLPKVEKKNAEDKSSQGKLSRQIANLKQTLKHTTENTMQLDTTIESRRNEIQKISNDINNERDYNEQMKQQMHEMQIDLLTRKLEKAKLVFAQEKTKTLSQRYDEVATSKSICDLICLDRFQPNMNDQQANEVLESERNRNQLIADILNRFRGQDGMLNNILAQLADW